MGKRKISETESSHSTTFPELPNEIRYVFESSSFGCLRAKTKIGVVNICLVANSDIDSFADKPILCQWQKLDELFTRASYHWNEITLEQRDLD